MLHEYREIISKIKVDNAHFAKIFEKHNALDKRITGVEEEREYMNDLGSESMKKEKRSLKDEAYSMIIAYKKEHNL